MIDFHCHLDLYPNAREIHAETLSRNAFTWLVTTSPKAFLATSSVLGHHEAMLISPGLHPELVEERYQELDLLLELIDGATAVGEIGLDGSKRYASSYLKQKQVFSATVKRCHDIGGRALSIHSRQAVTDVLTLLREYPDHGIPVLHWFTGTISELNATIAQGCWFSIGPAAFNSASGKALAKRLPKDKVVSESDGPFAKLNGHSVMPWDFDITVSLLSDAWSMPFDEVRHQITYNSLNLLSQIGFSMGVEN
ncbi:MULTISPECIES: Qat anti-phage system TatD family nuclease QatD [unclassified Shewanella]|uniref:Qat anti-phage system TatD family nuclease QatD n=1 Tax=unclassified Shewanella TaxID=196818 RepID=UPI0021D90852|nr:MULTISPECIES: Qat anti-phage system TatD family nuclease QatD [unclassified Shewanella]MCU8043945.1 TatD family hydrolase [Shewanella sp. SM68]MCU8048091.1 TatD family hydrolase [Shewanella sp. SM65]